MAHTDICWGCWHGRSQPGGMCLSWPLTGHLKISFNDIYLPEGTRTLPSQNRRLKGVALRRFEYLKKNSHPTSLLFFLKDRLIVKPLPLIRKKISPSLPLWFQCIPVSLSSLGLAVQNIFMKKTKQSGLRTPGKARSEIHFCNTGKEAQEGKGKNDWQKAVLAASYYHFQLIGCSPTWDIWLEFITETNTESMNTPQHTPTPSQQLLCLVLWWIPTEPGWTVREGNRLFMLSPPTPPAPWLTPGYLEPTTFLFAFFFFSSGEKSKADLTPQSPF